MLHSFDSEALHHTATEFTADGPTNEQLMERIKVRDESALKMFFERHRRLLGNIVSRIVPDDADVDEVLDDCMLEIWNHADHYDATKGMAIGWLVTLVRRRSIDRVRRKMAYRRAQDRFRVETEGEVEMAFQAGADEDASLSDRAAAVAKLIETLPPAQQEAVRMTYFRGMSQRDISRETGIPLGTIKTRLELGLRKLKSAALAFGELDHTGAA